MAIVDLVMPKMGESISEATILKWHKKTGDPVQQDETLLDIATDKVDSEVPSNADGIVQEVLYRENDVVPVGAVIARINTNGVNGHTNGSNSQPATAPEPAAATDQPEPAAVEEAAASVPYQPADIKPASATSGARFYSPLVLKIAQEEGISMTDLEKMPGTGQDGRVSKKDMLDFVAGRQTQGNVPPPSKEATAQQPAPATAATEKPQPPPATQPIAPPVAKEPAPAPARTNYGNQVEIVEMDRMRKMIAKHMVDSKHTSPHVTSFAEADVTNMVLWREKVKQHFEKQEGTRITYMPLFIEAIVKCIKKYPFVNSSIEGENILLKKDINIGMATALPNGNLIVPVIRNADQLNLVGLSKQVNNLADAARNNRLRPDDTQGGTFTITNVGTFGSLAGTPIINQPQVAILAVGAIKKRPVVVETAQGDSIAIRHMMYLSLSYDHRIVDGSIGASFLSDVARELESWDNSRQV